MARSKRGEDGASFRLKAKHGCVFALAIILIPLAAVAAIFYFAGLVNAEWDAARPQGMSDTDWAEKRSLCETASLSAEKCGVTPTAEVEKLSRAAAEKRRQELCADKAPAEARAEAEKAVLAHLKSPSSADFVGSSIQTRQAGCNWTVSGEVDAQNTFGAMVRSSFRVELRRVSDDMWVPMSVRID